VVKVKCVVQKVLKASVSVEGKEIAAIEKGLLVFISVCRGDSRDDGAYIARKVPALRIFPSKEGTESELSLEQVGGEILVVPQFTLAGDVRKGNRPSFGKAEAPDRARHLIQEVADIMKGEGHIVHMGPFREHMIVNISNDGPYTVLIDSKKTF